MNKKINKENSVKEKKCKNLIGEYQKDIFTKMMIENLVENANDNSSNGIKLEPDFVVAYLKRCDSIINNWKMSEDTKTFIKGGFSLLASLIPDNCWKRDYDWIANAFYPEDIEELINSGGYDSAQEAIDEIDYEIGCILTDFSNSIEDGVPYSNWEEMKDIIEDYEALVAVVEEDEKLGSDDFEHYDINKDINRLDKFYDSLD